MNVDTAYPQREIVKWSWPRKLANRMCKLYAFSEAEAEVKFIEAEQNNVLIEYLT